MPVRRVGPLTTRGAVSAGQRVLSSVCTASNSAASMIGGTAISTTSASGLRSRIFQNLVLKRWRLPLGALIRIAFLFEAPAGVLSVQAPRRCQNQCVNKHMGSRPERAAVALFSLAVLIGRDLRPSSRPVMSGIVDSGPEGGHGNADANDPQQTSML